MRFLIVLFLLACVGAAGAETLVVSCTTTAAAVLPATFAAARTTVSLLNQNASAADLFFCEGNQACTISNSIRLQQNMSFTSGASRGQIYCITSVGTVLLGVEVVR